MAVRREHAEHRKPRCRVDRRAKAHGARSSERGAVNIWRCGRAAQQHGRFGMAAQQEDPRVDTVQAICGDLTTVYLESEKVLPKQPKTLKHQYPWR
eukprot:scaffold4078_cov68-Phaeocystis_antarctica.AAC.20